MSGTDSTSTVQGRIIGGAFAGAVFGFLGEVILLDRPTPEDRWMMLLGPIIGAGILAILAAFLGHRALPPGARIVAIAVLSGVIVGFIVGWALFPIIMMASMPNERDEKSLAAFQIVGTILGTPIGAMLGLVIGIIIWRLRRTTSPQTK